jgi:hypothetical protein
MSARERVLGILADRLPDDDATALAGELGSEIRKEVEAELRDEFELDLKRIREETFDLGVRTAVRLATEQRSISPTAAKLLAPALAAHESRKRILERMQPFFENFVEDMPEPWSEISDSPIVRTEAEKAALVKELLGVVESVLP